MRGILFGNLVLSGSMKERGMKCQYFRTAIKLTEDDHKTEVSQGQECHMTQDSMCIWTTTSFKSSFSPDFAEQWHIWFSCVYTELNAEGHRVLASPLCSMEAAKTEQFQGLDPYTSLFYWLQLCMSCACFQACNFFQLKKKRLQEQFCLCAFP